MAICMVQQFLLIFEVSYSSEDVDFSHHECDTVCLVGGYQSLRGTYLLG